ncbi:MAG TPA: hypothetical protein ENH40_02795 [Nitrospirae bacterium]|nr:hypothetical protein [Nitrospirota bacterium]
MPPGGDGFFGAINLIITYLSNNGRAQNHFHNPLLNWDEAGLNSTGKTIYLPALDPFILSGLCNFTSYFPLMIVECGFTGESSVIWSQNENQHVGGEWSWQDAREYFYIALSGMDFADNVVVPEPGDTEDETRDKYFAKTFRSVGQLMHLVEDMSVPLHTRNDVHILFSYEGWVESLRIDTINGGDIEFDNLISNPVSFHSSIFSLPENNLAKIPIAKIIDTDQYSGANPDETAQRKCSITDSICNSDSNCPSGETCLSTIGLSEYSNANFITEDTNFKDFSYPAWDSVEKTDYDVKDPRDHDRIVKRQYYKKTQHGELGVEDKDGDGNPDYRIATVGFLKDYILEYFPELDAYLRSKEKPALDSIVYQDYADLLVPRAVGYSAGLLDYFFRGELYVPLIVPSNDGPSVEGIWGNQTDTGVDIDKVAVFVQNNSKLDGVIEPIGAGILTLTISYTDTKGTPDPDDDTIEYESAGSFSVTDIPETGSGSYSFALFTLTNPIQPNQTVEDLTYHLAFKGQLGNEQGAVIGRVIKSPVLHSVSPDEGKEGDVITITGNNLPMPPTSDYVRFQHNLTEPYTVELLSKTDTEIIVKVPNTAGLKKPGYGGLRVSNVSAVGEKIYSNPVPFYPIAQGEVTNTGQSTIDVTITANAPIVGDNNQLPLPSSVNITGLAPGASLPVNLKTGYNYTAAANSSDTQDIEILKPGEPDFIFEVQ